MVPTPTFGVRDSNADVGVPNLDILAILGSAIQTRPLSSNAKKTRKKVHFFNFKFFMARSRCLFGRIEPRFQRGPNALK
jgi:hypothetical protein